MHATAETSGIPLYLILESSFGKQIETVTCDVANRKSSKEGLYALIMEVEKAYARKWGQAKNDGGQRYGRGLTNTL